MDQKEAKNTNVNDKILRIALAELNCNLGSNEDVDFVKYILLDRQIHDEKTVLGYFNRLLELQEISDNDVSIIYELLFLMKKNHLWTKFRKRLIVDEDNIPDYDYFGKGELTHFTDFRVVMIKTGHLISEKDLPAIKLVYEIQGDFKSVWTTFLHLEKSNKVVNKDQSLNKFEEILNSTGICQAGNVIRQYVGMKSLHKCTTTTMIKQTEQSDTEMTGKIKDKQSLQRDLNKIEINKRKQRINVATSKVTDSTEQCKEFIHQTGEQLKNKIDQIVSELIDELERNKTIKLEKLSKITKDLEAIEAKHEATEPGSFDLDEDFYPEDVGYFRNIIKRVSNDFSRFVDSVLDHCQYIDYKPVDATKCCITLPEIKNKCHGINETLSVRVDLKDSDGNKERNDESAAITVEAEQDDSEKSSDYELTRLGIMDEPQACLLNFKFKSTGLWRLCIYVGGEMVSEAIDLKIISSKSKSLIGTIPQNQKFGGPIFDVCFTSSGLCLLACNNTNKVFSFPCSNTSVSQDYKVFTALGDRKKFTNLCCIDKGDVYLTEVTKGEIFELDYKGNVCNRFGRGDFKFGAPQGIAATHNSGAVHVFVSNNEGKCVQHYLNKVLCETISDNFYPDKTISPWFLDVNNDLKLFICNDKATSSSQDDTSYGCFVEVLDVKSKAIVKSIKCDSAVCIDEKSNVFVGMSFGIKMFDKDFKFIKEVTYSGDPSYGLSAFSGCLAVVYPGSIKVYRY